MKNPILIAFTLALTLGLLPAIDADTPEKAISLAGTKWSGTDSDGDFYIYEFELDGTLAYKSPTGSYRNGTWKQFGSAVYMETNHHVSERLGEIRIDVIEGKAWNAKGRSWTWKASIQK